MNHTDLILFIFSLAILLLMAIASGRLAQYFKMPKVIGELVGGIILGPTILGLFCPDIKQLLFASSGSVFQARDAFVKLGAILLLFVIGLEINLPKIKALRKTIAWTSFFGSSFPFILGLASVFLFPRIWNYSPDQNKWLLPLFIGTALSISALPVIARILLDLGLIKSKVGSVILATATIDDIVGWIMFAIIVANFSPDTSHIHPALTAFGILIMFLFTVTIGKKLAKKLTLWIEKKPDSDSLFLGITLVLVLLSATLAEAIGIHAVLGAFLVGIAFSSDEPHKMHTAMRQMILSFFSPLYFVAVGLQVDFLKHFDLMLVLVVIGIATLGKVLGAFIGAKISKLNTQESLAIGFGMNARGAVEIILATSAYQAKLIDERIFVAIIIMAIATTLMSGPLMKKVLAWK
ncbi:MAG: cation:proton antiporter [Parcubacteria group bacterium]|jgi:Kef-type K+ transport system membrane component KefB